MKSTLRRFVMVLAVAMLFLPAYPVIASLLGEPAQDRDLSEIQGQFCDVAPNLDRLH